jgi:hypothetical protein
LLSEAGQKCEQAHLLDEAADLYSQSLEVGEGESGAGSLMFWGVSFFPAVFFFKKKRFACGWHAAERFGAQR